MSTSKGGQVLTFTCGATVLQYEAVFMQTDGFVDPTAATTATILGFAMEGGLITEKIAVQVDGVALGRAEAATNPGVLVGPCTTSGDVEPAVAGTNTVVGMFIGAAAAADGDIIPILIMHGSDVTP